MAGKYEIAVACRGLKNKDTLSKSDPVCIMYEKVSGRWQPLGRTELLRDTLNPVWGTKLIVDYRGDQDQRVKFCVYDGDDANGTLKDSDFLGAVKCPLGKLIVNRGQECSAAFKDGPSKGGEFLFNVEAVNMSVTEVLTMCVAGENLDKKDLISKSDPFFTISKQVGHGSFTVVHKSEMIKNTQHPSWAPFRVGSRELCNGDYERPLRFDIFDYNSNDKHDLIGSFVTNVNGLQKAMAEKRSFPIIDAEKMRKKKNYKNSGVIYLKSLAVMRTN